MADTAAHLVDHVLPHAPVRQWVLSFPFRIRFLLASSSRLCAAVRGIFTRTLLGWLEQRALAAAAAERTARSRSADSAPSARREPELAARSGAVVFAQSFGGALNLNLHFHALVLDGAFVSPSSALAPHFKMSTPARRAAHRWRRRRAGRAARPAHHALSRTPRSPAARAHSHRR